MRPDANRIALTAIRNVLAGAHPLELDVASTIVRCTVTQNPSEPWPSDGVPAISEAADGPWPAPVLVTCTWEGGECPLQVHCEVGNKAGELAIAAYLGDHLRQLVYVNVARRIGDSADGALVHIRGDVFLKKRKTASVPGEVQSKLSEALSAAVAASRIPLATKFRAQLFDFAVPTAELSPQASTALRNIIHLALFKLDFLDRGERQKERGRPIIDVPKLTGISANVVEAAAAESASDEEDDADSEARPTRFWAGGFQWDEASKRDEFVQNNYWQLGWPRDVQGAPAHAQTSWRRFDEIEPGDLFAIKGYGGSHDLHIHYVGKVASVDREKGRLELERLDVPLYRGKAPRGSGGGNWFDSIVPIQRKDVIESIFGQIGAAVATPTHDYEDIPLNLILYGPPGTGKTFRLQTTYIERFTRSEREVRDVDIAAEIASDLTYFEVIVVALASMPGKKATVDQLLEHPLVKAKYQTNAPKSMRQILWGTLGAHTIEESKTVKMKRRFGDLVFDKSETGEWFIAAPLTEELEALTKEKKPTRAASKEAHDFDFLTFHQAYAYEDFIEGIRPRVTDVTDDEQGTVGYTLEDGIFKRAVRKALQRTKFAGTIDDFCKLSRGERAEFFDGVPHYAVFIDEINRGNVARVFGELITLLEDDKRLGEEHELIVRLPYSGTLFGVPPNLHVIGTMNTADRSVEALDAALRRRFEFVELAPQPEELKSIVAGAIDPRRILQTINRRLEKLRDRDHCIGHAWFMALEQDPSLDNLKRVFGTKIIPLLQEYFFGDWGKIGLVLGKDFVRKKDDAVDFADFEHDDRDLLGSRAVYELVPMEDITDHAFRRIYEDVASDD